MYSFGSLKDARAVVITFLFVAYSMLRLQPFSSIFISLYIFIAQFREMYDVPVVVSHFARHTHTHT